MEYKFKVFQKEGLSFRIKFKDKISWEGYYLSRVIKLEDDKNDDNEEAKLNDIKKIDSVNFSAEDLALIRDGILPIRLSSLETDIPDTEYVFQVKVTNENNDANFFVLQGTLEIEFDYDKR